MTAEQLLAKMTLQEKAAFCSGVAVLYPPCPREGVIPSKRSVYAVLSFTSMFRPKPIKRVPPVSS